MDNQRVQRWSALNPTNPYLSMTVEEREYYMWLWRWRRLYPSLWAPGLPPVTVMTLEQRHYEASAVSRWNPPRW